MEATKAKSRYMNNDEKWSLSKGRRLAVILLRNPLSDGHLMYALGMDQESVTKNMIKPAY